MRTLPNLKLTEKEINLLLQNPISDGSEGIICQGTNQTTVYKFFFGENKNTMPRVIHRIEELTDMVDNKHKKIQRLHQKSVEGIVKPISSITCNDHLLGYEMTTDEQYTTLLNFLKQKNPSQEETIAILKAVKERLQYFSQQDIIYGDVALRNILIDKNDPRQITFCDIDNMQVERYPIDLIPRDAREYHYKRGIDEKLDAYMHNYMIISALKLNFELIDFYCMPELIPYEFHEEIAPTILSMENPEYFTGQYIIDYVKTKEEQVQYLKSLKGK